MVIGVLVGLKGPESRQASEPKKHWNKSGSWKAAGHREGLELVSRRVTLTKGILVKMGEQMISDALQGSISSRQAAVSM